MNILYLDYAYIMNTCLPLYADKVNPSENAIVTWNNIEKEFDTDRFIFYDSDKLSDITRLFLKHAYDKDNVKLITSDRLEDITLSDDITEFNLVCVSPFNLLPINNDMTLNEEGYQEALRDNLNFIANSFFSSNKVKAVWYFTNRLDGAYTNPDTADSQDPTYVNYIRYSKYIMGDLEKYNFDCVIFNKSEQFVPHKYHDVYNIMVKAYNDKNRKEGE